MTNISMTDRLGIGSPLPDIRLPRLSSSGGGDGGDLALDSLRGKRLLLFFWGSW